MAHSSTGRPVAVRLVLALILLASLLLAPVVPDALASSGRIQAEAPVNQPSHDCRHEPAGRCCLSHCLIALPVNAPLPLELSFGPVVGQALKTSFEGAHLPRIDRPPKN